MPYGITLTAQNILTVFDDTAAAVGVVGVTVTSTPSVTTPPARREGAILEAVTPSAGTSSILPVPFANLSAAITSFNKSVHLLQSLRSL